VISLLQMYKNHIAMSSFFELFSG